MPECSECNVPVSVPFDSEFEADDKCWECLDKEVRRLRAEIAKHAPAASREAWAIKPLEWNHSIGFAFAETVFGCMRSDYAGADQIMVLCFGERKSIPILRYENPLTGERRRATVQEAVDFGVHLCQSEYNRRVQSCLVPVTPAVDVEALAEKIHEALYGDEPYLMKDEIAAVLRKELNK